MRLLITDKKATAEKIASTLGDFKKYPFYFKSSEYYFCWTSGLIVLNGIGSKSAFKSWTLNSIPFYPKDWVLEIANNKDELYDTISKIAKSNDVNEILCATEPSREGQLIFELLYRKMDIKKPAKRVWYKDLTEKEIKNGLINALDNHYFLGYYYSALARNKADFIYGTNLTRLLSLLYSNSLKSDDILRVGRVQTPALVALVEREMEVESYKPLSFYEIKANLDGFSIQWYNQDGHHIFSKEDTLTIQKECMGHYAMVTDTITKKFTIPAPLTYNLGDLQKDAELKYSIMPDQCAELANSLYEKGLISYPKTEVKEIPLSMKTKMVGLLKKASKALPELSTSVNRIIKYGLNNHIYKDLDDLEHGGIIFTHEIEQISKFNLSEDERRILVLIVSRIVIALAGDHQYSEVKTLFKVGNHYFRHIGIDIHDVGWKDFYNVLFMFNFLVDDSQRYFNFEVGESYKINSFDIFNRLSEAPKPLSVSDLLDSLYKTKVGSVTNRGSVIKELASYNYISINKNKLYLTERGRKLYSVLSPDIRSNILSSSWEEDLEQLLLKRMTDEMFIEKVKTSVEGIVHYYKTLDVWDISLNKRFKASDLAPDHVSCPACGATLLENSKKFYCSTWKSDASGCNFELWKNDFRLSSQGFVLSNDEIIHLIASKSIMKYNGDGIYHNIKLVVSKSDGVKTKFLIEEI